MKALLWVNATTFVIVFEIKSVFETRYFKMKGFNLSTKLSKLIR